MSVDCAPTERGNQTSHWFYKHLAPTEPGKTVLIERIASTFSDLHLVCDLFGTSGGKPAFLTLSLMKLS